MNSSVNSSGGGGSIGQHSTSLCCLIENGQKCTREAGNASYSKRIEKQVSFNLFAIRCALFSHR